MSARSEYWRERIAEQAAIQLMLDAPMRRASPEAHDILPACHGLDRPVYPQAYVTSH
jgi:hypothetical protein